MKILTVSGNLLMAIFTMLCLSASVKRNSVWQDKYTLDADAVYKSPLKARPHLNMGLSYFNEGKTEAAIREYLTALMLAPDYAYAHNNLGVAYYHKGLVDEAITNFKNALEINPDYAEAHLNLGIAYGDKGLEKEAYREMSAAMRLKRHIFADGMKR